MLMVLVLKKVRANLPAGRQGRKGAKSYLLCAFASLREYF